MDHTQRALETFRKPYTCAQTVYAAFKEASETSMADMKSNSGGRAPSGECGSLYAAKRLIHQRFHPAMEKEFSAATGDLACKKIKGEHKTSCETCVREATKLVLKYWDK